MSKSKWAMVLLIGCAVVVMGWRLWATRAQGPSGHSHEKKVLDSFNAAVAAHIAAMNACRPEVTWMEPILSEDEPGLGLSEELLAGLDPEVAKQLVETERQARAKGFVCTKWSARLVYSDIWKSDSLAAPYQGYVLLALRVESSDYYQTATAAQSAPRKPDECEEEETHGFELRDGEWRWVTAVDSEGTSMWGTHYNTGVPLTYPGP
jgi:hypothetical protein